MEKLQKEALQVTKEIMVKFVEAGRITPTNFAEHFPAVYSVVVNTLMPSKLLEEIRAEVDAAARRAED